MQERVLTRTICMVMMKIRRLSKICSKSRWNKCKQWETICALMPISSPKFTLLARLWADKTFQPTWTAYLWRQHSSMVKIGSFSRKEVYRSRRIPLTQMMKDSLFLHILLTSTFLASPFRDGKYSLLFMLN